LWLLATMSNEISSFRQSRNKLNMFNLFRLCRKDEISFDIVAKNGNTVAESGNVFAKNCNDVEAKFDFVDRIVRLVAFDNVTSTLLLVWTGLQLTSQPTHVDGLRTECAGNIFVIVNNRCRFRCCVQGHLRRHVSG